MSLSDIDAYCITLDPNNKERAGTAEKEISGLGFRSFTFVSGVDIRKSDMDLRSILSVRAYYEVNKGRYVHEALSGTGSIGCYLAHYNLWKRCADEDRPIAIFEDDFSLRSGSHPLIQRTYAQAIERGCDIFRIVYGRHGDFFSSRSIPSTELIVIDRTMNASGYILQPKAARALVNTAFPIEMHADHYLDMASYFHDLLQLAPAADLEVTRELDSTIRHNSLKRYPKKKKQSIALPIIALILLLIGYCLLK